METGFFFLRTTVQFNNSCIFKESYEYGEIKIYTYVILKYWDTNEQKTMDTKYIILTLRTYSNSLLHLLS